MEANYFTILYWFCHTSTWIRHGCTCVPHPEPLSHLPPCTIPLGHPSAPAPSILYPASNLDWWFVSHVILYMSFSQTIPPSPSPTESKRLFYTSVSIFFLFFFFQIWPHGWSGSALSKRFSYGDGHSVSLLQCGPLSQVATGHLKCGWGDWGTALVILFELS